MPPAVPAAADVRGSARGSPADPRKILDAIKQTGYTETETPDRPNEKKDSARSSADGEKQKKESETCLTGRFLHVVDAPWRILRQI